MTAARIVIVADDLTGAAEIAGIAAGAGTETRLRRVPGVTSESASAECIAWDTDSRVLSEADAVARVGSFAAELPNADMIYKKTDSVLRGHIAVEIAALLRATGKRRALLVPQNPSKGRVIVGGRYAIAGVPLDQTDFGRDPDYPCKTACVCATLGNVSLPVACVSPGERMPESGIIVGCAATVAEVGHWAGRVDGETLAAGGADFFQAILASSGAVQAPQQLGLPPAPRLIVCGSAAASSRAIVQQSQRAGLPIHALPVAATAGTDASIAAEAKLSLVQHGWAILAITHDVIPAHATTLRARMAVLAASIVNQAEVRSVVIEGGATAATVVEALGWNEFCVRGNLAPGVVAMHPLTRPDIHLVIKPGSYPWPDDLLL